MSDLLLENQNARKLIKTLGLPIPVPERLARAKGPYEERPLDDKAVLVCGTGTLSAVLAEILTKAGANPWVVGESDAVLEPYNGPGEAWARAPRRIGPGEAPEGERIDAIVFDGTGLESPDDLRQLYDCIHPWIRRLNRSGRVVIIGRPASEAKKPARAATRAGLEGFTRSLAKEIGA
ncbi:MAG: short chain dehydrogenase, partial [Deltaproteobacteria bacterium]|nr:short chain dehydrogenase [Deltaproteobacteria bacterium]